jgi:protein required for attachment to host cells
MSITIPKNALIVIADAQHVAVYRNVSDSGVKIEHAGELMHHTATEHLENKGAAPTPSETSPHKQEKAGFAKRIADDLYARVHKDNVQALVLIASPQTLGQIRQSLRKEVTQHIVLELPKDLVKSSVAEIEKILVHASTAAAD